jgi:hypothetical protein
MQQITLLVIAPLICILMIIIFPGLTNYFGKTEGYIAGFCVYWLICLVATIYSSKGLDGLMEIYCKRIEITNKNRRRYYFLAFIPCLATLIVVFGEIAPIVGFQVLLLSLLFALINGTLEEMFWRGAFNKLFDDIYLAYMYPSIFFGIWHIALFLAKGMVYQGGFPSLVGGALFMGLLWGLVAFKTKSIKIVTVAHVITNFFAFTGLIFENWFI